MRIILASASPQRKSLLEGLGITFEVIPSGLDEGIHPERDPRRRASVLARLKAQDVFHRHPNALVIGCDTLVVASDGTLLEKPKDAEDADRMLRLQSGQRSIIHSAVCICHPDGDPLEGVSTSTVAFRTLSYADREWWISTRQWKDRSGAFQIDGLGQLLIMHLEGDWTGVVGLPVFILGKFFREIGIQM